MAMKRHSTIQFNPTEWLADTARMPRIVRSVYLDLCVYTWERAAPVPASEVFLMISDLPEGQGEAIIENLVQGGHLERLDGAVFPGKAMIEAQRAYVVWEAKSRGGRGGAPAPVEEPEEAREPQEEPPPPVEAVPPSEEDMRQAIDTANSTHEIAQAWNALAAGRGLKQVVKMTRERVARLHERIADHGAEAILAAIRALADNEIVLATKPTFDALLNPETCTKMVAAACGEGGGQALG